MKVKDYNGYEIHLLGSKGRWIAVFFPIRWEGDHDSRVIGPYDDPDARARLVAAAEEMIDKPSAPTTRVLFKFNAPDYVELPFVRWTPHSLIVRRTAGEQAEQEWRMGRNLVNKWLASGVLKIEGYIPDWALIV